MTIGEYIKQKRQSAGMTQQDLASKVGISYQQLSQYERGVRSPKPEMLEKLSEAIGYYFPEFMRLYYASLSKTKEQGQPGKTDLFSGTPRRASKRRHTRLQTGRSIFPMLRSQSSCRPSLSRGRGRLSASACTAVCVRRRRWGSSGATSPPAGWWWPAP